MTITKRNTFKDYFLAFLPPAAWAGIIFVLSSQKVLPGFDLSVADFVFKKSAHIFVYGVLYFLLYRALFSISSKKNQKTVWLQAVAIALLYALSDEYHQSMIIGRYATLRDIGYDMLGVSLVFFRKFRYI